MNINAYSLSELLYYQFISFHLIQIDAYNQFGGGAAFHQDVFLRDLFPSIIGIA